MATWKKVIVSGSGANLSTLQVDNLTSGQVVIGGGTGNLSTTAINGTGQIVATTAASGLIHSGSFSGSFQGTFTGTGSYSTNALSSSFALTASFFNGSVTSASYATTSSYSNTSTSASYATSATTAATASYVLNAVSASFASTASFYGGSVTSASYALSSSVATSASYAASTNNITNAITNNTDNYILTATGGGTINGESNLQFNGSTSTLTVTGNATITNNLIVQGTASFQNTTNLEVADRFILLASGSNAAGDGGIVVQQATQNVGELFGFENSINRWGFTSSFSAGNSSYTAAAYATTTEVGTVVPTTAPIYGGASNGFGNIYVKTDTGDIYIYA